MIDIELNKIPYTGGYGYTEISPDTFSFYFEQRYAYKLEQLIPGNIYTIFRIVKRRTTNEIYYTKIHAHVTHVNLEAMQMYYGHKGGMKRMCLDDYQVNWCFFPDEL